MSYRFDEVTGEWVLMAPLRRGLPMDAKVRGDREGPGPSPSCPFCPGNEASTEVTLAECRDEQGLWQVRTVRNRYPSVTTEAGTGEHEVVIEAREHTLELADMPAAHARRVFGMYRDRVRELEARAGIAGVYAFRNRGWRAGSSQSHPHGQVVATQVLSSDAERRALRAREHARARGQGMLRSIVARERTDVDRVVYDDADAVVFCPFASHRAFETWIVPHGAGARFAEADDAVLDTLARVVPEALRRLRAVTGDAAYNVLFRGAPVGEEARMAEWYVEIAPRTGGGAGFELQTGIDVVPTLPEVAAAELREAVT